MKHYLNGYSLVEALISVLLLGIISSFVIPSLSLFLAQNRLDNTIAQIFKALNLARGYAVSHSTNITICPLISGSCKKEWHNKLFVFEDRNRNLMLDDGEYIIKVLNQINSHDEISYPRRAITYRPDGSINFMHSGSFVYCNKSFPNLNGNRLTVSQVGRIRIVDSDKCKLDKKE